MCATYFSNAEIKHYWINYPSVLMLWSNHVHFSSINRPYHGFFNCWPGRGSENPSKKNPGGGGRSTHHTNVYKTSVCTYHFETGKVPYFKAVLLVVSIDIRSLLFTNCKQAWKGLLFSVKAYHCSLYLTFVTYQFCSQSQLPPKSRWTSNLVLIWVFLRYSYRE